MKNKDLNVEMEDLEIFTHHPFYYSISAVNYEQYKYFKEEYKKLTNGNKEWDMFSHTKEENDKYMEYWSNYKYYAFVAVVFQALAVEAYINYYGFKNLGDTKFETHYEKIDTVNKYIIIYEIVNKKEFPKSEVVYEKLKKLIGLRNHLVHSKASKVNMKGEDLQKFMNDLSKPFGKLFSEIDNVMTTYNGLVKIMSIKNI